jgi:fatty acid desaturase
MTGRENEMSRPHPLSNDEALEDARRHVRRKRIYYLVLGVWIALCVMWFVIDLTDDSSSWWFYWPVFGSGVAVAITGIVLLGIGGLFGADWERREIDTYLRRRGKR